MTVAGRTDVRAYACCSSTEEIQAQEWTAHFKWTLKGLARSALDLRVNVTFGKRKKKKSGEAEPGSCARQDECRTISSKDPAFRIQAEFHLSHTKHRCAPCHLLPLLDKELLNRSLCKIPWWVYLAGEMPRSQRWFSQGEAHWSHSGCTDTMISPNVEN